MRWATTRVNGQPAFPMMFPLSYGFYDFTFSNRFSNGFPMDFPMNFPLSYGFPVIFPGFPIIFPFSHGFSDGFSDGFSQAPGSALRSARRHLSILLGLEGEGLGHGVQAPPAGHLGPRGLGHGWSFSTQTCGKTMAEPWQNHRKVGNMLEKSWDT